MRRVADVTPPDSYPLALHEVRMQVGIVTWIAGHPLDEQTAANKIAALLSTSGSKIISEGSGVNINGLLVAWLVIQYFEDKPQTEGNVPPNLG